MRHSRSGNAAVQVGLSIWVIVGFAAIGIDLTVIKVYQQELYNAAEAASHAGAAQLDGTADGVSAARTIAEQVGEMNTILGSSVAFDPNTANAADGDIVLGRIDFSTNTFVPTTDPATAVAVKAKAYRGGVGTYFARLFGLNTVSAEETAIAVAGGPRTAECPMPIAVPECALPDDGICDFEITMSNSNVDNAAWALPQSNNPSASDLSAAINGCTAESSTVDVLSLNNGQIQSVLNDLQTYLRNQTEMWDTSEFGAMPAQPTTVWVDQNGETKGPSTVPTADYGKVIKRLGMVYDDPSNCTNSSMNYNGVPIKGYVTMVVYDIRTSNSGGNGRWVKMRIACDEADEMSGGGFYGTTAPPRMIVE
ncbi:MAG: TadG family pilus assembly protein [Myxococcota bacterium]